MWQQLRCKGSRSVVLLAGACESESVIVRGVCLVMFNNPWTLRNGRPLTVHAALSSVAATVGVLPYSISCSIPCTACQTLAERPRQYNKQWSLLWCLPCCVLAVAVLCGCVVPVYPQMRALVCWCCWCILRGSMHMVCMQVLPSYYEALQLGRTAPQCCFCASLLRCNLSVEWVSS